MAVTRVTQVGAEVLTTETGKVRVTQVDAEVLHGTYEVRLSKAVGYAVLTSTGNRVGLQKAQAYAVLDSGTAVRIQKAVGYAVLFDTTINLSSRRRPVIALCG